MIDIEVLRDMKMIEERIGYENDFISIEDIMKSEELDYYTSPNYGEYFLDESEKQTTIYECDLVEDFDWAFDMEDCLLRLRDERLIKQKEAEMNDFEIDDAIAEYDPLAAQIDSFEYEEIVPAFDDYDYECFDDDYFDYDDPLDDYMFFDEHSFERNSYMEASYCGGNYLDYMPYDDKFYVDGCDYPDGPDENLLGIKFIFG